jgi:hypothetical protein
LNRAAVNSTLDSLEHSNAQNAQQLDGADPASPVLSLARYQAWLAGRLISTPFVGCAIPTKRRRAIWDGHWYTVSMKKKTDQNTEAIDGLTAITRDPSAMLAGSKRQKNVRRYGAVAVGAQASGTMSVGSFAIGALAVGAAAIGALAIGRLAIKRLTIHRSRIERLEIDELVVRRLQVDDVIVTKRIDVPDSDARSG